VKLVRHEPSEQHDALDLQDERLLEELRRAAGRHDPPPASVTEAAQASLTWRSIDAELAALAFDSAVDQPESTVRSGGGPRQLAFDAPGLSIEVEVSPDGTRRRMLGQLTPPGPARIEVRHPGGVTTVDTDAFGRFRADAISAGPVSLRCSPTTPPSAPRFVTEWVPL
jgi:hypothetical protein